MQVRAAALKPSLAACLGIPFSVPCSCATSARAALAWTLSASEIEKGQPAFPVEAPPWLSRLGGQHRLRQFSNPLGKPAVPKVPGVCRRSMRTPHAPKGSRRPASVCPWGDGLSEECCGHSAWLLVLLREERRGLVWFGFGNLCSQNLLASGGD